MQIIKVKTYFFWRAGFGPWAAICPPLFVYEASGTSSVLRGSFSENRAGSSGGDLKETGTSKNIGNVHDMSSLTLVYNIEEAEEQLWEGKEERLSSTALNPRFTRVLTRAVSVTRVINHSLCSLLGPMRASVVW